MHHYCCFLTPASPPSIHTLSLHDALPILRPPPRWPPRTGTSAPAPPRRSARGRRRRSPAARRPGRGRRPRSEEHTSELQSRGHLVCRLLLEKQKSTSSSILSSA